MHARSISLADESGEERQVI